MRATVRLATRTDIDGWLAIVREWEWLFGPMTDFDGHIERGILRGTALVATDGTDVIGGCLLSPADAPHEIRWLALRHDRLRQGIGSQMLNAIEAYWPSGDISVVTFAQSVHAGEPARRFYESRGFEPRGDTSPAQDGSQRLLYVLSGGTRVRR